MPRSVPLVAVEGDVRLRDTRVQTVLRELVLAERAREVAAVVLAALEVDDERAGEFRFGELHPMPPRDVSVDSSSIDTILRAPAAAVRKGLRRRGGHAPANS